MHTKESLKSILKQNVVTITFKKVDGTDRTMRCSLKEDLVPVYQAKDSSRKKPENDNLLPVWDLENNAFRSFRVDSLINYEIV